MSVITDVFNFAEDILTEIALKDRPNVVDNKTEFIWFMLFPPSEVMLPCYSNINMISISRSWICFWIKIGVKSTKSLRDGRDSLELGRKDVYYSRSWCECGSNCIHVYCFRRSGMHVSLVFVSKHYINCK